MDQIVIRGGRPLNGRIPISGAKNAALTLMPCALLTDEPLTLRNLPRLADIDTFGHLLNNHGLSTTIEGTSPDEFGRVMTVRANRITSTVAPYDIVRKMRASILVLGPLLARAGEATVSLPGGCAIGNRPIDLHLKALEHLGAEIELAAGYVKATAKGGLPGGRYVFPLVSVGATENAVMAAVLARGPSILENVAREPEIVDLCNCLVAMGAHIQGIGTETLEIEGVRDLHGATYAVMPDRIEAGSYACAAAITGGEVELIGVTEAVLGSTLASLREAGVEITPTKAGLMVKRTGPMTGINVSTAPYPGFADRHAGAVHGDADGCRWRVAAHRNHLRKPLHARARTGADGRRCHRARALRRGARRWRPARCTGHGDRPARLDEPRSRRPRGRRAKPPCRGSITSIAAMNGSRKNCRRSVPISNAFRTVEPAHAG